MTVTAEGSKVTGPIQVPNSLLLAQNLANLSDTAVRIPFTRFRVGLDFLIGLIPGIGDTIMLLVGVFIIFLGRSIGVPKSIIISMLKNSLIDYLLGLIPFVGDIFDAFYKANQKNVRLMERWWLISNKDKLDESTQQQLEQWQASNP